MRNVVMVLACFSFCCQMWAQITPAAIGNGNSFPSKDKKLEAKFDSIFSSFNKNTPGVAVTVLENGKVIAKKAYGLASLEHQAPFTHNSVVRIAYSEGREFISIAAVLMEQEGLLSLNDKVRKYFPKLPSWSEPVTIYDLLNHRSGFVDEWATLLLSQASMTNRFDESQFLNLLYKQPKPEVEPGKGYMYSNSDFGLLRLILEKASGQNLRQWMKTKIFDPLDMRTTLLHDDKDEVIAGFANRYYNYGQGYKIWNLDKTSPGGNYFIATTVNDLEKWAAVHRDTASFISKAASRLFMKPQFMPGKDKNYVFGYKEKKIGDYKVFAHQGVNEEPYVTRADPGYVVILLTNSSGDSYSYHEQILSYLLEVKKPAFVNKTFKKEKIKFTPAQLQQFTGTYLDEDTITFESFTSYRRELFELKVINDSLKMKYGNTILPLDYIAPGVFKDVEYPVYLEFVKEKSGNYKLLAHVHQNNKIYNLVKDTSHFWQPSNEQLQSFSGKYYSPHLGIYWTIVLDENKLIVKRSNIADTELDPHINKTFRIRIDKFPGDSFNSWVKFHVDEKSNVTHLIVKDSRLMGHRFDKVQ
jgi:CubicO group peptidase (beta-lactamase class C family)